MSQQPQAPSFKPLQNTTQKAQTSNSFPVNANQSFNQPTQKIGFPTITQHLKQQPFHPQIGNKADVNQKETVEQLNIVVRSANQRKQQIQEFYENNKQ